jgi:hypothetical protein
LLPIEILFSFCIDVWIINAVIQRSSHISGVQSHDKIT